LGGRKGIRPVKNMGVVVVGASLVWMGWHPLGLPVPLPPLSPPAKQKSRRMMAYNNIDFGYHPVGAPHAYINRRWGNPAWTQHSPMLRQKAVYMMTLPGLINCGRAGPLGLVPGMLTH